LGTKYLDFNSGIAVNSFGHADPEFCQIIAQQAGRLIHISNLYHNEYAGPLAEQLATKVASNYQVFFSNSGTEANEAAFKFSRLLSQQTPGKVDIISFYGAFHGRTYGAVSATPNPKYQNPFYPLVPGFRHLPFNDIAALDNINSKTCAVIFEPVQGEGGVVPARTEFIAALVEKCKAHNVILIADCIQVQSLI
jgi:acetylornithine aminotransferase